MPITVAKSAGFCYGVANAVNSTDVLLEECGSAVNSLGPIIHNEYIINRLTERGVKVINSPEEADEDATVIIRAHGVGEGVIKQLEAKNCSIEDLTCPFVKKIHNLVREKSQEGYGIVVVGNGSHPEVLGICGWSLTETVVIESPSDLDDESVVERLEECDKNTNGLCCVCQTTFTEENWKKIKKNLKKKFKNILFFDTICFATAKRQQEAIKLAQSVDVMIVIGSRNSSNTLKLRDVCSKQCSRVYLIENAQELATIRYNLSERIGITAGASTPDCIIEEVIGKMVENTNVETDQDFGELLDQFEGERGRIHRGATVKGTVIRISNDGVYVNLGYKADGIIPVDEFIDGINLQEGEEIESKVVKVNDQEGIVNLSIKHLQAQKRYEEFEKNMQDDEVVEVEIFKSVKGGVLGKLKGMDIFIPAALLSDRFVKETNEFVGKKVRAKIISVDPAKRSIKASCRAILSEEKTKMREEAWAKIEVGATIKGTVKNFTDFRAFVDLGGVDGSIHISEISWDRIKHPSDALKEGEEIEVIVLDKNEETKKIALSSKKPEDNPWFNAEEKYAIGTEMSGEVVRIVPFGAFVKVAKGVDALVHISQISDYRLDKVEEALEVGQTITGKVIELDVEKKRISLSIKEVAPINPAARVEEAEQKAKEAEERRAKREAERAAREEERNARLAEREARAAERARKAAEKAAIPTAHNENISNTIGSLSDLAALMNDLTEETEE